MQHFWIFPSCKTETLYPLTTILLPPSPGNHHLLSVSMNLIPLRRAIAQYWFFWCVDILNNNNFNTYRSRQRVYLTKSLYINYKPILYCVIQKKQNCCSTITEDYHELSIRKTAISQNSKNLKILIPKLLVYWIILTTQHISSFGRMEWAFINSLTSLKGARPTLGSYSNHWENLKCLQRCRWT